MLRRLIAAVPALAICACEPSLPQVEPTPTVTAIFDPSAGKIPLPNDLVFANPINSVCPAPLNADTSTTPMCAQAELLKVFNPSGQVLGETGPLMTGRFPSDQEVPLTIQFTKNTYVNGRLQLVAPDLDLTTILPAVAVVNLTTGKPEDLDTPIPSDYVVLQVDGKPDDHGTLSIHRKGRVPWLAGRYTFVMRGGPSGVKTKDSPAVAVAPSTVFALVEQGKDMTAPENLGLLKAQSNGSTEAALALGAQLNGLISLYQVLAFPTADLVFGGPGNSTAHTEMAITSTFQIDATVTNVVVDPARGMAPLPFDVLRDSTTGKITASAACSLAGGTLDAMGACSQPAAAAFQTLDGFSTTGAILAPTSAPINTGSVDGNSLKLFDMTDPNNPVEVSADNGTGSVIRQPCEFSKQFVAQPLPTCVTNDPTNFPPAAQVLAFQPAGASSGDPSSVFRTQPLKDNTDYAVVITNGVKDLAGKSIGPGTVAKILRFNNPLSVGGHSALQGIDDVTAGSLEKMRKQLVPLFNKLGAATAANVVMAYTFHTQIVLAPAVQLAALPYVQTSLTALPSNLSVKPKDQVLAKWGAAVPNDKIVEILEADISTFNALDPVSGAFNVPDQNNQLKTALEPIHVLIAVPDPTLVTSTACSGGALKCAPLMVFRHGLGRGRADMLAIANAFAAAGMVTVAIDAAKHGDRTLCSTNPDPADPDGTGCAPGSTCVKIPNSEGQGDAAHPGPPGTCSGNAYVKIALDKTVVGGTNPATDGVPKRSGNYLVSANFFRTRDTLRQDLIDESQLIRAMAVDPTKIPAGAHHVVFDRLSQTFGMMIDPTTVFFSGQSLGAIQGTLSVAANPRILKAGLNVGGGSIVDIFTNAPAFATQIGALLSGLHIVPGTPQFLQFLTVAKTILDPADPVNFAGHITAKNLPDLITPRGKADGTVPQLPKDVLIQMAFCDTVVPNPFGLVWGSNLDFAPARATPPSAPLGPLPNDPAFFGGGNGKFQLFAGAGFTPTDLQHPENCLDPTKPAGALANGGGHRLLLDPTDHPDLTTAAQASMASFMVTNNAAVPSLTKAAP